jgi:hypothetical protein
MVNINRNELVFPSPIFPNKSQELVKKLVEKDWPEAVYESAEDDECPEDMFIYQNQASKEAWEKDCQNPASGTNMIYAQFRVGNVTLVHDNVSESETLSKSIALYFMKLDIIAKNPTGVLGVKIP